MKSITKNRVTGTCCALSLYVGAKGIAIKMECISGRYVNRELMWDRCWAGRFGNGCDGTTLDGSLSREGLDGCIKVIITLALKDDNGIRKRMNKESANKTEFVNGIRIC